MREKFKKIDSLYMSAVKSLLGVRSQTRNDVVLVEGGFNNVAKIVNERRCKFLEKKLTDPDEPLTIIYNMCKSVNTRGYIILSTEINRKAENTIERTKGDIRTNS